MLKRFGVYCKGYWKYLILSILLIILECGFELYIPLLMTDIIDVGVANGDKRYILVRSAAMIACALISLVIGLIYARVSARASQGFGSQLRKAQYQKVQSFSFSNMDHFRTSSLVTRLTSDVTIIQNALVNGLRPLIRAPVMLTIALTMSIIINRRLAMVFIVSVPALAICLALVIRSLRPMYGKMQKAMDNVNSVIQENLIAIRVIKSYVRGDYERKNFGRINEDFQTVSEKAFHYAVMNAPCLQAVSYATILSVLWFGNGLIQVGGMQVGALTGFLSYIMQIMNSLMMISGVFMLLTRSITSGSRILEVMDEEIDIKDEGVSTLRVEHGSIDFEHVYFKYQNTAKEYALSDITLHIEAGQTVGIIGGTGSAKSTLVQLIPRLYDITSGCLKIDGQNVPDYPVAHLRDMIGMVLQKNTLFSGTIRENLLWGNKDATQEELDWACKIACAKEFIDQMPMGYETELGQGGSNVSGGQKQRLCIARALLKRPKVLIFDDSTSAVDTATEAIIQQELASGMKDTTKIIIAQRVTSVEHADQIVILENGQIHEIGTHEQLLDHNPIYQEIWNTQKKGAAV